MGLITIQGKILLPDGNGPDSGRIVATLSENATIGDDRVVGRKEFVVPPGGDLAIASPAALIEANDGMSPSNTFYDVEYTLYDTHGTAHGKRELWQLSGSGPQAIGSFVVVSIPPATVINGIVPDAGSAWPPTTTDYHRALRTRKRVNRPEELGILLWNYDGSVLTWKRITDGEP